LYCNQIGVPLRSAKSFNVYIGGCPANVVIAAQRLGLRTGIVTRVGIEPLGDLVVDFLASEGISTEAVVRDQLHLTGLAVLGIEPPDTFPLTLYRRDCADIHLTLDDVRAAPFDSARVVFVSGTGFSREPSTSATLASIEAARAGGALVVLDLDFRAPVWDDVRAYGLVLRRIVAEVDVVVGTEVEIQAAADQSEVDLAAARLLALGRCLQALVIKRGQHGSTVMLPNGEVIEAPPFRVDVLNVIGAGDAYVAGLLYGRLKGWTWYESARFGNAVGAIIVTRHACSSDMPSRQDVQAFIAERGGL
jgi:5-dehydro-2-deoxygluconokinase